MPDVHALGHKNGARESCRAHKMKTYTIFKYSDTANSQLSYRHPLALVIAFDSQTMKVSQSSLLLLTRNCFSFKSVRQNMVRECKCHGVSEACTVQTCWKRLPNFRRIGDVLKEKFDSASMVEFEQNNNRNGHSSRKGKPAFRPKNKLHKAPTIADLVYYEDSPDFCRRNPETGSLGTKGRLCNNTSEGTDGCNLMCCYRGYTTSESEMEEMCNCRFHWCCKVKCENCRSRQIIHRCN